MWNLFRKRSSSNTGNIGIGTTTPVSKLEIAGLATLTSIPAGTGVSQGALYINPASYTSSPIVQWTAKAAWNAPDFASYSSPTFADLNGDGKMDMLLGMRAGGVTYAYQNTGTTSSPAWTRVPSWDPPAVVSDAQPAFADLDGDGKKDLLIGSSDGISYAYRNTGTTSAPIWTAQAGWNAPDVGSYATPAFADLNNDGKMDLMIGSDGITYGYVNTGTISAPIWTINSGWNVACPGDYYSYPGLADLDGDGDLDLMVGAHNGTLYGLENTGTVSNPIFTLKPSWNKVIGAMARPAFADLDGDGDPDLLAGTYVSGTLAYENTGSIGAASNTLFGIAVGGSQKFKVNGLGNLFGGTYNGLTLTSSTDGFTISGGGVASRLLTVSGSNVSINQNLLTTSSPTFAGMTLNGNLGIGTATPSFKLDVRGAGAAGQINAQAGLCIAGVCKTSWTDGGIGSSVWTTSGNDIYSSNTGNIGIGTTTPVSKLEIAGLATLTSIPTGTGVSQGSLYINPSSFSSAPVVTWAVKSAWDMLDVGDWATPAFVDLNGDGVLDLMIGSTSGVCYAYQNVGTNSSPSWSARSDWNMPDVGAYSAPAFADLNGDGKMDVLIGELNLTYAYENTGTTSSPTWTRMSSWDAPNAASDARPAFADLNNDGRMDLLVGGYDGISYAYQNTGTTSSPVWTAQSGWNAPDIGTVASPAFADFNGDGKMDLMIGEHMSGIVYGYENTGTASSPVWTARLAWNTPSLGGFASVPAPAPADLDGDGDEDLLIGTMYGISYGYENTGSVGAATNTIFGVAVGGSEKLRVNGLGQLMLSGSFNSTNLITAAYSGTSDALSINQVGSGNIVNFKDGGTSAFMIKDGGNVGIGTSSPLYKLEVNGSARVSSLNINGAYSLPTAAGTTSQFLRGDGTWAAVAAGMNGSGTTNYLSKFTGASSVGNSLLFDDGTAIGIGTETLAGARFKVALSTTYSNITDAYNDSTKLASPVTANVTSGTLQVGNCGGPSQVSDIDSNVYGTVAINGQCWMASNMMTTRYPGGANITRGPTTATWDGADNGYYAYPPNTSNNAEESLANITANKLGFVYQWSAAMNGSTIEGAQGICPTGWHVPSSPEYYIMEDYLKDTGQVCVATRSGAGCATAGTKLKIGGSSGMNIPLPGDRNTSGGFSYRSSYDFLWSSTQNGGNAWDYDLSSSFDYVNRVSDQKSYGFTVRCLKDSFNSSYSSLTSQSIAISINLLASNPAFSISNFHYNIATLPGNSSIRMQFSKDNTNWYSSTGTPGAWDTLSTTGGVDISLASFVTASSWTNGNAFYYKVEINSTSDYTQTPTIEDMRLDYVPLSGSGGLVFDNSGNFGVGTFSPTAKFSLAGGGVGTGLLANFTNGNATSVFTVLDNGSVGIGTASPTALLNLGAGTATAGTAPLKFTTGTLLSATEGGAMEFDGSHIYFTAADAGTRYQLDQQSGTSYSATNGLTLTANAFKLGGTLSAATDIALASNNLTFSGLGNVGIGTTTASYKLDVRGTGAAGQINAAGGLCIAGVCKTAWTDSGIGSSVWTTSGNDIYSSNTGNIGIGTTTPVSKLEIAGLATLTSIPTGTGVSQGSLYINPSSYSSAPVVNWVAKSAWNGSSTTYPKLAFADLDGDGDKDLLIGAGDGRSRGYENTGTVSSPSWVAKSAWDVPDVGDYAAPALADLDGDGDYDLIVGIFTGGTYAYENTGTVSSPVWTRKSAWDVTGGGMFSTPAFADLDNDGKIDFLLGSDGGAALGYRNTGTVNSPAWTATPAWNGPSGTFAAIALADLDGDSDRDLLIGTSSGITYAYENTGTVSLPAWTAKSAWNLSDVGNYSAPALADLDNDGDFDLLVGETNSVSFAYENTGSLGAATNTLFGVAINGGEKFKINGLGQLSVNGSLTSTNLITASYNGTLDALTINQTGSGNIVNFKDGGTSAFMIKDGGNIGIGTTTPLYKLEVNGSAKVSSLNINGAYTLPTAAGTTSEYLRGDGTWAAIAAGMSGTGTTNYLSKFTGASSLGNSLLFDDGTGVGIGTTTLAGLFDVNYLSTASYYTKLLLHADGSNNSTTFTDSSDYVHAVTAFGNAKISTSQSKFGGSSAYFDGVGDYMTTPDSDDWTFGTGNYTIDFWFRTPSVLPSEGTYPSFISQYINTSDMFVFYWHRSAGQTYLDLGVNGSYRSAVWPSVATDTQYHIALVRDGLMSTKFFVNGVLLGTSTDNYDATNRAAVLKIGGYYYAGADLSGYMDELRISKGIARWTSDFVPPVSAYTNGESSSTSAFLVSNTGNVGIGTINPTQKLMITGGSVSTDSQFMSTLVTGMAPFSIASTTLNTNLNADLLDGQHGNYYAPLANISGTTNYLSRFTGTNAIGSSLIYDNGTNVGIGTATPNFKLDVQGTGAAGQINAAGGLCIAGVCKTAWTDSGIGSSVWITSGNDIYSSNTGNIGIGTTTPVSKLEIAGLATLTSIPTGTGVSQGALYINPASYSSNPIVQWTAKTSWNLPAVVHNAAPAFADLDGDGKIDVLIGAQDGKCYAYQNTGTTSSPAWTRVPSWEPPDVASDSQPAFADLDGDGKMDLLIGAMDGISYAYRNTGTTSTPVWTAMSSWNAPNVGTYAAPAFADLNNDGKIDLLIGESSGTILAYQNIGTTSAPVWTATPGWNAPSPGSPWTFPILADLDGDGDKDLLAGAYSGVIYGYENTGTVSFPAWTRKSAWDTPDVGFYSKPALADLESDGDYDLLIGEYSGASYAYENTGSIGAASNTVFGIAVSGSEKLRVNGLGQLMLSGSFNSTNLITAAYSGTSDALSINQVGSGNIVNFKDGGTSAFMIKDGGNIGIGTTTPLYKLEVNGSAKVSSLNINGAYSLPTAAGTTSQFLRGDGTWAAVAAGMNGSGTTNYLSKFTGASSVGNSLLFDDGTAIGIGTETLAGARFKVALSTTYSNITDLYNDQSKITSLGGARLVAGKLQAGVLCGTTRATTSDADGNSYNSVLVNDQCWMASNLRTTKYPGGASITRGATGATWNNNDNGYYAYPPNTSNTAEESLANITSNSLGFVYQWSAAMNGSVTEGAQGICPTGWHLPTDAEQYALENYLKDNGQTCDAARQGWDCSPAGTKLNVGGVSGMNLPPSGRRNTDGSFLDRTTEDYFWSSLQDGGNAIHRRSSTYDGRLQRSPNSKAYGFSVRCLMDTSSYFNALDSSTATSVNLLASTPAFTINNFHYNITTLPGNSSIRIQFSKDNTNWYSAAGTLSAWTTISTIGGADIDMASFVAASSWTNGNAFYYKMEINPTSDYTQTPTIEDIRLDYVPLSGSGGLVFDNSGNLGVGTFSPTAKFSLAGGGVGTGLLANFTNGNATSVFTVLDNGNVGIGTTSPLYKLDIAGDVNITGNYKVNGVNLSSGMTNPMTTVGDLIYGGTAGAPTRLVGASGFLTSTGSAAPTWTLASADYFTQYALLTGRSGGQIITGGTVANDTLVFKANSATSANTLTNIGMQFKVGDSAGTNALTILNNGNVGIGTTNPAKNLSVIGSALFKSGTNVADAFDIKNSGDTSIFKVDTLHSWVGINKNPIASLDVSAASPSFFDDFETGQLSPFESVSTEPWVISNTYAHSGIYSAGIVLSFSEPSSSTMSLDRTLSSSGTISFYYKCYSGFMSDSMVFWIDSDSPYNLCAPYETKDWTYASYSVTAGAHTFYWKINHTSGLALAEYYYIDDVDVTNTGTGIAALFSGGNVGIGTVVPGARLQVVGADSLSTSFAANIAGATETGLIVTNAGNVGIGTTNPTEKLMVAGNIAPSADDTYDLGSTTNRWRDLYLGPASLHIAGNTLSNVAGSLTWNGQGVINSSGAATFNGANIGSGSLYVDSVSSNVGIGTTSPGAKFAIGSSSQFQVNSTGNVTGGTYNALTLTAAATGFTIAGGTIPKTLIVSNTLTLAAANDTSTLNIGTGGTLGTGAYATIANYAPIGQTMYIGTTAHAINRGTGAEALTGITGLTPSANFVLTQNSVAALTSEEAGAVANTMYLKAGNVGIGTNNPTYKVDVRGSGVLGQINAAAGLCIAGVCKTAWTDSGIGSSSWVTTGNDIYYTLGNVGIGTTSPQAGLHVATSNILFGSGNGTATPSDVYIKGPSASGTNISGSNMFLDTPAGTGTGNSGSLIFRTSPGLSWQPIALDNSSVGAEYAYNGSGILVTISHAVDAGKANKILIVATSVRIPIEYVRYDGVDMHLLDSKGSGALVQLWYLKDSELHTGTHNVTIHSTSTNGQMSAVAETFYNVDQTNSFGTTNGVADNWGSSISTNVSAATNDMVIDVVGGAEDIGTPSVGSGQTLINYVGSNNANGIATSYKAGASTVNMSWTNVGGGYIKSQLGVALQSTKSSDPNAMAEAMRINYSGNLGIGTTAPTQKLAVYNGSTTGTYTTSGWAHSSDARLKTNIMDVTNPLDKIKALSGVYFNWNANPNSDRQIGLIAQDTLKVLPEVVVGNEKDGYGIAYGNLSALLIEGVKAQQTQLSSLSALTNSLQSSNNLQDNEIQKLNQALALLKTDNQDQTQITNQKISSIQNNLATAGSQINLLSTKLNSASNLLAQNTQPTQELPFYQFKTQSSEISSPLTDQIIENNQFVGTYNSPNNFQELNLQLHPENQLNLEEKDQNQTFLVYDVYMEDPTTLEDYHTELGNSMDQKEFQWDRPNHPNFTIGWNEVRLPITDGTLTGTIDWQYLSYFRAYFKFNTNTNLKFKNIRLETKAKYIPLAQTINTNNLDLWNNADQGTALKSIFSELDNIKTQELASLQTNTKLTNDLKTLQDQMALLQDQTRAIIDFSLALNLNNVIYRDTLGNVDLTGGKITAKDIEALSTVKATDIEATNSLKGQNLELGAQVSGTNMIKAGQVESVKILTSQANAGIKLYITPKGSTQGKSLYYDERDIEPGVGFRVRVDAPALDKDIEFNWLIVK